MMDGWIYGLRRDGLVDGWREGEKLERWMGNMNGLREMGG